MTTTRSSPWRWRTCAPATPTSPDHLLGDRFTLRQLRQVHQAVAGEPIGPDKIDTFRRKMKLHLTETQDSDTADSRGRPARLFQRADS